MTGGEGGGGGRRRRRRRVGEEQGGVGQRWRRRRLGGSKERRHCEGDRGKEGVRLEGELVGFGGDGEFGCRHI